MAVVLPGPLVHSVKGRLQGSVFRKSKHGIILYSNNWSKRGHGFNVIEQRYVQSCINGFWRNCTDEVKASYQGQNWQYPGGSNSTRKTAQLGSTATQANNK